jgi:hypothetical protein
MPSSTSLTRKRFLGIAALLAAFAVIFLMGSFTAKSVPQPRKYSSSARLLITPLPAGGLNSTIQSIAFKSSPNVELRLPKVGNVFELIAFAPTAEEAETKATNANYSFFIRTVAEIHGTGIRVSPIQNPQKAKLTTFFNR